MKNFHPPTITLPPPADDDLPLGHLFGQALDERTPPKAVIVGVPCDEGVRRDGGRVGASAGPDAIRRLLYAMMPDGRNPEFRSMAQRVQDLGNLTVSGDVEQDQELLGVSLAPYLTENVVVIVLGGGQDVSYGHFMGYVNAGRNVAILNWDSHCGVEKTRGGLGTASSAFRQALLHPSQSCRLYTAAALQPQVVAATQLDFISNRNGRYYWARSLTEQQIDEIYAGEGRRVMVSFDLQALDQSQAPGVNRPCPNGLTAPLWLHAARRAGRAMRVSSIDLVELNPLLDRDSQTARLAALTVWNFLAGLAERF